MSDLVGKGRIDLRMRRAARDEGVNDAGAVFAHKTRKSPVFSSRARLQLNHSYTRSDDELQAKIRRGSNKDVAAEKHIRRVMRIVQAIESDTVEDRTALDFVARRQALRG